MDRNIKGAASHNEAALFVFVKPAIKPRPLGRKLKIPFHTPELARGYSFIRQRSVLRANLPPTCVTSSQKYNKNGNYRTTRFASILQHFLQQ